MQRDNNMLQKSLDEGSAIQYSARKAPPTINRRAHFKLSKQSASSSRIYSWRSLFYSSDLHINNLSTFDSTVAVPNKSILKIPTQYESQRIIYGLSMSFGSFSSSVGSSMSLLSNSRSLADLSVRKNRKKVTFKNTEIREYDTTVGDNPHCSCGVAISLDWNYAPVIDAPSTVDEYESLRAPRKKMKEMILSEEEREEILLRQGVSHQEINKAVELQQSARERRLRVIDISNRKNKKTSMFCPLGFFSRSQSAPAY